MKIRKILAVICAFLFIIAGVVALFLFSLDRQAFASAGYRQMFESQNLYPRMTEFLANALQTSIENKPNLDQHQKEFTVDEWEIIIPSILPPEEIKLLTNDALDSVFDYLNNKTDSATISLLPIKQHLVDLAGVEAVRQILLTQPDCTGEQLLLIGLAFLSEDMNKCNPPKEAMRSLTPFIEFQLQAVATTIPDLVILIPSTKSGSTADPRINLDLARAFIKRTLILPLILLFALTIVAVRSREDLFQWWGYPILITGASCSLMAWIASPVLLLMMQKAIQSQNLGFLSPIVFSMMKETADAMARQILESIVIEGLIFAALGLAMVVVASNLGKAKLHPD